jgi:hypothetical protein
MDCFDQSIMIQIHIHLFHPLCHPNKQICDGSRGWITIIRYKKYSFLRFSFSRDKVVLLYYTWMHFLLPLSYSISLFFCPLIIFPLVVLEWRSVSYAFRIRFPHIESTLRCAFCCLAICSNNSCNIL